MSKAYLEYNLADPDDRSDFDRVKQVDNIVHSLHEFEQWLRQKWKYDELADAKWEMIEETRNMFYEILSENSVDLDGL